MPMEATQIFYFCTVSNNVIVDTPPPQILGAMYFTARYFWGSLSLAITYERLKYSQNISCYLLSMHCGYLRWQCFSFPDNS